MKRIDLPTLVTGLVLTGFAVVALWFNSGRVLLAPGKMWFAAVLLVVGCLGLLLSLGKGPGNRR